MENFMLGALIFMNNWVLEEKVKRTLRYLPEYKREIWDYKKSNMSHVDTFTLER